MDREEKSKRCRNEESWVMDGMISMLPDELLVIILSHLTLKEAAATSILSRRWRYLWTFTEKLDFDGTNSLKVKIIDYINTYPAILDEKRSNYVKWVNHVIALRSNSAPVHDFKVVFDLNKSHEEHIHEWIRYAIERKVQTLELNLKYKVWPSWVEQLCSIPYRFLKETCSSIHFKQLRRISLEYVNVSGEALEFLLCNCPLLEGLSVCESRELVTLRVIGPIPSLKLLEIRWCARLKSVEIRDVDLVSLKYSGSWKDVKFVVENAPVLVELSLGPGIIFLDSFLVQFWRILDQLEILNVEVEMLSPKEDCRVINLKFRNLKQLVVTYTSTHLKYSVHSLTSIIGAASQLEKFELKAKVWGFCCDSKIEEKEEEKEKKNLYENLKEVRFVGFSGAKCELKLVKHLVKHADALQKITIDTNLVNATDIEAAHKKVCIFHLLSDQVPHPIILKII